MKKLIFCLIALCCAKAHAFEVKLQYGNFYDHIKQISRDEYSALDVRFSFVNPAGELCHINSARIESEIVPQPIELNTGWFLEIEEDKGLDVNKGVVVIDFDKLDCNIKVQIVAKDSVNHTHNLTDLNQVYQQLALFMEDMGGMFSFLMPKASGVVIHMQSGVATPKASLNGQELTFKDNKLYLTKDDLEQKGELLLSRSSQLITAWMK
jgi:hypothetical protein